MTIKIELVELDIHSNCCVLKLLRVKNPKSRPQQQQFCGNQSDVSQVQCIWTETIEHGYPVLAEKGRCAAGFHSPIKLYFHSVEKSAID